MTESFIHVARSIYDALRRADARSVRVTVALGNDDWRRLLDDPEISRISPSCGGTVTIYGIDFVRQEREVEQAAGRPALCIPHGADIDVEVAKAMDGLTEVLARHLSRRDGGPIGVAIMTYVDAAINRAIVRAITPWT